jgi:hypothetical protein
MWPRMTSRRVDEGGRPLAGGGVDLRALRIHPVHQLRVERSSLAQQGKEQFVLAGVVRVEEVRPQAQRTGARLTRRA